ncbi:hypothetical protein M3Y97_01129900 [Aphelenchoides bicaudatus]|nr:hypothetical protein M3Y97_01129900 [Aphelenchoides bicaudatus]
MTVLFAALLAFLIRSAQADQPGGDQRGGFNYHSNPDIDQVVDDGAESSLTSVCLLLLVFSMFSIGGSVIFHWWSEQMKKDEEAREAKEQILAGFEQNRKTAIQIEETSV